MLVDSNGNHSVGGDAPKLRTACENCRQSKVKCNLSGKNMCTRCLRNGLQCRYGFANRSGKPKGSKNRATLRKLGQLREEKSLVRGVRGGKPGASVADHEPLVTAGHPARKPEAILDDDVCLIPGPNIWDSPRGLGRVALETPICHSQMRAMNGSPFTDFMDTGVPFPLGLGYPQTPVTPTFLASDPLGDGMTSPPLSGSVSSPFSILAPCECVETQLFHMNGLNQVLAESQPLRFDQCLQTIKATFGAAQIFLQCRMCVKDSVSLELLISALNLTLQLFEYWISLEASPARKAVPAVEIRYGYYEVRHEENLQIRTFLLRSLLLQCRDLLSLLRTSVSTSCLDGESPVVAKATTGETGNQPWCLLGNLDVPFSELDPDLFGDNGSESNRLLPIIAGYETTVDAFLRSVSTNECICGSKYVEESL